jgi:DNA-binding ferritin-like protein
MPRSVEEILQHADELAERFENVEADPADELDARAATLLREAIQERSRAERHLLEAVRAARQSGMSWSTIGTLVGTTGEAARQKYADRVA